MTYRKATSVVRIGALAIGLGIIASASLYFNCTRESAPPAKEPVAAEPAPPQPLYYGGPTRNLPDDTFQFAVAGQPKTCDPHKIFTIIDFTITLNTSEGLVTWGPEGPVGGIQPGIAEKWEVSPDGRTYTFTIGANRKWSNGVPILASDIAWSWNRARGKETNAIYRFLYDEAMIESFEATDLLTFRVTLKEPRGFFLDLLTMPVFHPVYRPMVEQEADAWCQPKHWVGTGPYLPNEEVTNDHVTLVKNPRYWDAENVHIERAIGWYQGNQKVHIDNYRQGRLDWLGPVVSLPSGELDQICDYEQGTFRVADATRYVRAANFYISANVKRKGFDNSLVRKALSLAIDRKALAERVLKQGDVPTVTFVPPGLGSYRSLEVQSTQDCTEAKRLMVDAGYPNGAGFPVYELLYRSNSENEPKLAAAVAQMWKTCLGITVTTTGIPMNIWQTRVPAKEYDITLDGWQGDYPHPQTFAAILKCGAETNDSGWCNPEYDRILTEAVRKTDPVEIQKDYARLEAIAMAEMAVIPLFFNPRINVLRPEWRGVTGNVMVYHPLRFIRRV